MNRDILKPAPPPPAAAESSPDTMSADKFSEITGKSHQWLRDISRAGYYPQANHGQYQTAPALVGWIKYQRDLLAKRDDPKSQELALLTKAKRELKQGELAVFNGDHIPKSEIIPAIRNIWQHQRAVLVHKLERELPPKLLGKTPQEQIALIKVIVDDVLQLFAEGTTKWSK